MKQRERFVAGHAARAEIECARGLAWRIAAEGALALEPVSVAEALPDQVFDLGLVALVRRVDHQRRAAAVPEEAVGDVASVERLGAPLRQGDDDLLGHLA